MPQKANLSRSIPSIGFFLALTAGLAAMLAGFGTRSGWWDFRTGFTLLRWAAFGGGLADVLCISGLILSIRRKGVGAATSAVIGLVIGVSAAGIPLSWMMTAKGLPMIHDISTDTKNAPQFVTILPLRKSAPNPSGYGGPEVAAEQQKAYPDVKPLRLSLPVGAAFDKALETAGKLGWRIVDANRSEGRIEATDTTFWFGFVDDIVIRIAQDGPGSVIDVRSVSRVGKSDVGTNAKRIESFLTKMESTRSRTK